METRALSRCFAIGVASGLRSMAGPAVARWRADDPARLALAALAAGELIADKLPATPDRTILPALVFRALAGGFAGRSVATSLRANRTTGMFAGACGALIATYAGFALRAQIVRRTGLPDPIVAVIEDVAALYGAVRATRSAT